MKANNIVNIGVIGVGHLGQHHVRHYSRIKEVHLSGLFDVNQEMAKKVAANYSTRSYSTLSALLKVCDAVSIVTPTRHHAEIAKTCIQAGKHVFIEKPITKTVTEADQLLALAKEKNVLIQVGHIERLNPALLSLTKYSLNPKYIEVQRLAPYTSRGTDVPVVLDLMIHDIDIILSLVNAPLNQIHASGVSIMTHSVDIANARLRFQNGTVASITSSRIAKDKVRKIKIFQRDIYVTIDFLLGLTEVYRIKDIDVTESGALLSAPLEANGKQRRIMYEKPLIKKMDALKMELANFIQAIKGKAEPIVDGKAGREALAVAHQIHDLILEDLH